MVTEEIKVIETSNLVELKKERRLVKYEILFWVLLIFLLILFGKWDFTYVSLNQWYLKNYNELLYIIIAGLVPFLFMQIYGQFPIQSIRNNVKHIKLALKNIVERPTEIFTAISSPFKILDLLPIVPQIAYADESRPENNATDPINYMSLLARESKTISEKILKRANTYLFTGSLIAVLGLAYFSIQTSDVISTLQSNGASYSLVLAYFLPRTGTLILLEFVAFFFLKQHRITLDEFKYYESIKRQRQSNLILLTLALEEKEVLAAIKDDLSLFNNPDLLQKDSTTGTIELRKYSNEELEIFGKLIEVMRNATKANKQ